MGPRWGRVGVGEASDGCLAPKRGFPLPDLPHVGPCWGRRFSARVCICDWPAVMTELWADLGPLDRQGAEATRDQVVDPGMRDAQRVLARERRRIETQF